jgi:hypothetical protein
MRSLSLAAALFVVPVLGPVAPVLAQSVPIGSYGCWTYTQQRPDIAFKVTGEREYSDVRGNSGRFSIEGGRPGSAQIVFSGGTLDKQRAVYNGGNPPAVTFLGPSGKEAAFCQLTR